MLLPDKDAQQRMQTISLAVLAVVALTYMVFWLRPVLVPFVVSIFVVSGISPILSALEKRLGVTRIVAAGIAFLAGVAVLVAFGITIWISVVDLSKNSGAYRARVRELVDEVEQKLPSRFTSDRGPSRSQPFSTDEKITRVVDAMVRDGISILSQALLSMVSASVIVLIFVFFLLIGSPTIDAGNQTVQEIDRQVRSYLSLKTVISIFTGLAFGTALRLFGVPMAFTFGVMAFLLNFVPNVGPIVASLLPVPLILLDPNGSLVWMISAIAVTSTIQLISGNIVEPKVMGNSSDLHPVTILLALMFWGMMWGVIGMFLATPITSALKIVLERIESTRPLAALMAGRLGRSESLGHVAA